MAPSCITPGARCGPDIKELPLVQSQTDYTNTGEQTGFAKRAVNPINEPQARDEMTFLSAYPTDNPSFDISAYGQNYVYDRTSGFDVTVYVLGEVSLGTTAN